MNYQFQIFDSRNTCIPMDYECAGSKSAGRKASNLSLEDKIYKVIVMSLNDRQDWEEYEDGERVSWSYPNGLGNGTGYTAN